ncbi:MAG: efflux RND transporter periplasmic adaptor subunit, partial [Acidobacteriota bacterium]|nr:efflux RND transporter periplasmic adaptor subunit [Acidobacteriota bacterium]
MRIRAAVWVSISFAAGWMRAADLAPVVSKAASHTLSLPGEFEPYERVSIHARVAGRVERVLVDRGSVVKRGQLLVELSAPEMKAEIAEAESRVAIAEADRAEAEARLAGLRGTAERMKEAAQTPGAVAGNELVLANQQVQAAEATVRSREQVKRQTEATVRMRRDMEAYLQITAPFDGVVTERLAHPGAIAGPPADPALLTIDQISRLRLVVALPEAEVGGVAKGALAAFHVPAF